MLLVCSCLSKRGVTVQHIKLHAQVFSQPVDSIAVQVEVGGLGRLQSLSLLIGYQLSTTHSQLVSCKPSQLGLRTQSGDAQHRQVRLQAFAQRLLLCKKHNYSTCPPATLPHCVLKQLIKLYSTAQHTTSQPAQHSRTQKSLQQCYMHLAAHHALMSMSIRTAYPASGCLLAPAW